LSEVEADTIDAEDKELIAAPISLWTTIRQAVSGSQTQYDYTQGSIGRAIFLLSVPMVLEMMMESLFAVADVFYVAHLGSDAVATVGLTESLLTLVYTVAMGLSIGATATVARRIGERDRKGAAHAATQAIVLGIIVASVIAVGGVLLAPSLLKLLGASSGVIENGTTYTRVMLGGNVVIMMLFLINAIFRGAGDAAIAMRVLWLANIINIILAPCLIFGFGPFPHLGLTGAAIATTIGRGIGALYAFSKLLRPGARVSIAGERLSLDFPLMLRLLKLSAEGALQVFIGMASWIGLIRIISSFGSDAIAGYTIGIRVILFALLPTWGMSNAAATMVGQSLGAGKPERAEQAVWKASFYSMCFLGVIGLVFVIFSEQIIRLFTSEQGVLVYGVNCLRIVASGFLFYAYGMVLTQSFNGAGDTWTPTLINLFAFWVFEIPVAYVLAVPAGMGPTGVFLATTIAFSVLAVVSAYVFRKGRWKVKMV
jgi:putative MATE family efflux protein